MIYYWRSPFLRQAVEDGHVIVNAESVEEARLLAKDYFIEWAKDYFFPLDEEEWEENLKAFEKDIAEAPTPRTSLIIWGSA